MFHIMFKESCLLPCLEADALLKDRKTDRISPKSRKTDSISPQNKKKKRILPRDRKTDRISP